MDSKTVNDLVSRQRLLLDTSLELLAELEDLGGEAHLLMRSALCAQLAESFLSAAEAERVSSSFFDVETPAPAAARRPRAWAADADGDAGGRGGGAGRADGSVESNKDLGKIESLSKCDAADLDRAMTHFAEALRLADAELLKGRASQGGADDETASRVESSLQSILQSQRDSLRIDCARVSLGLARRHLDQRGASNLMHELRRCAALLAALDASPSGAADGNGAPPILHAALWHVSAAFARGVSVERFRWSDSGAHSSDAMSILRELDDLLQYPSNADNLQHGCFSATASLCEIAKALVKCAAADDGAAKGKAVRGASSLFAAAAKFFQTERRSAAPPEPALHLLAARACALQRCLTAAERSSAAAAGRAAATVASAARVASATRRRLGDACNAVGSGTRDSDVAQAWLAVALQRLGGAEGGSNNGGKDSERPSENIAIVHLNLALLARRAIGAGGDFEAGVAAAIRHCDAASEALGWDRDLATAGTWDKVQLEKASALLMYVRLRGLCPSWQPYFGDKTPKGLLPTRPARQEEGQVCPSTRTSGLPGLLADPSLSASSCGTNLNPTREDGSFDKLRGFVTN
ncbi:hypothetical protein M885DRAFT_153828 [Pelagophyceae sp. CCMP2097]|nr:hypothetical protein M885DRAFT_153828 [Pelagophyceae sp. CCMP2097]